MADKAISALTSTATLADTDDLVLNQSAGGGSFSTKRIAVSAFKSGLLASPKFYAYLSASQNNLTGNGTQAQINWDTAPINAGSLWDTTNKRTAVMPAAGTVKGEILLMVDGPDNSVTASYHHVALRTNTGRGIYILVASGSMSANPGAGGGLYISLPYTIRMSAGEYFYVTYRSAGYGADTHDLGAFGADGNHITGEFTPD